MARPLPLFGLLLDSAEIDRPENVRVFEGGRFLYGSFDYGQEQVLDIRAHDRLDLLEYWCEWMRPALAHARRHSRTPAEPARAESSDSANQSGEFRASQPTPTHRG